MIGLRLLSPAAMIAGALMAFPLAAPADAAQEKPAGIWLTTDFPSLSERIGEDATLSLKLTNSNLPPERIALSVEGLPKGWSWRLTGEGKTVAAAMVAPGDEQTLRLKLTQPKDAQAGTYHFTVLGAMDGGRKLRLPIALTLATADPDKITLEPKLPALRGSPKSQFDFNVAIKNDSAEDTTLNLAAETRPGFTATFTEQYGSQELSSLPFKAGESKTVKVAVQPPADAAAGHYPVTVQASNARVKGETALTLDIIGHPQIAIGGVNGRLSGEAVAGKERNFDFTAVNSGTAAARNLKLSAATPSGWKVEFDPKTIAELAPNADQKFSVRITPSDKAIAGDYMVTVRALGDGISEHADFRVTVTTSTLWGIVGLCIIGAALVVFALAVSRYGRR